MSRKDDNIKAKSENLLEALSELMTSAGINTNRYLGQGTKKLSKFASSRDFKSIIFKFLSHLDKLLSIFDLLTVKKESFCKKAEILLKANNISGNVRRFQKCIKEHKTCKIDNIDGHHWVRTSSKTLLCSCDSLVPLWEGFVKILCDVIKSHCSSCKHKPKCFICVDYPNVKQQLDKISSFPVTERAVETDDEPSPVAKDQLPQGETGALDDERARREVPRRNALSYHIFSSLITKKYEDLKEFWETSNTANAAKVNDYVLVYKEHMGQTKYNLFGSRQEALWWCYDANNRILLEKEFPVVLIFIAGVSRCENIRKKKAGMNPVGTEDSPSVMAALSLPNSSCMAQEVKFYIDTGADGGSVGYNPEFIKDFVFSAEEIEGELKPVIFGQITVATRQFDWIQSFDVDPNPLWNALGLEQTNHFDFFHFPSKQITFLLPPNNVFLKHSDDTRLPGVGYPQEIRKSGFASINVSMTKNEVPVRGLQAVNNAACSQLASSPGSLSIATRESFLPTASSTTAINGSYPPTVDVPSSSSTSMDNSYTPTVAVTNSSPTTTGKIHPPLTHVTNYLLATRDSSYLPPTAVLTSLPATTGEAHLPRTTVSSSSATASESYRPPTAVTNYLSATRDISYPPSSAVLISSPATTGEGYLSPTAVLSSLTLTGESYRPPTAVTDCLPTTTAESYPPVTAVTNSSPAATGQTTAFTNSTPHATDESCPPIAILTNSSPTTTHESFSLTTVTNCLPTATDDGFSPTTDVANLVPAVKSEGSSTNMSAATSSLTMTTTAANINSLPIVANTNRPPAASSSAADTFGLDDDVTPLIVELV